MNARRTMQKARQALNEARTITHLLRSIAQDVCHLLSAAWWLAIVLVGAITTSHGGERLPCLLRLVVPS
jgi:hypothetical protein